MQSGRSAVDPALPHVHGSWKHVCDLIPRGIPSLLSRSCSVASWPLRVGLDPPERNSPIQSQGGHQRLRNTHPPPCLSPTPTLSDGGATCGADWGARWAQAPNSSESHPYLGSQGLERYGGFWDPHTHLGVQGWRAVTEFLDIGKERAFKAHVGVLQWWKGALPRGCHLPVCHHL